jgi:hypothetical protein
VRGGEPGVRLTTPLPTHISPPPPQPLMRPVSSLLYTHTRPPLIPCACLPGSLTCRTKEYKTGRTSIVVNGDFLSLTYMPGQRIETGRTRIVVYGDFLQKYKFCGLCVARLVCKSETSYGPKKKKKKNTGLARFCPVNT